MYIDTKKFVMNIQKYKMIKISLIYAIMCTAAFFIVIQINGINMCRNDNARVRVLTKMASRS